MKALVFLLSIFLTGCGTCNLIMSQIPPQFVSPTVGCTAPLPDYKVKVTVTDNCAIASYTQVPAAGTMLLNTTPINVTLKATDVSGNIKQIVFSVTLRDTVKPVFHIDPLLTYTWDTITKVYNQADRMVSQMMTNEGIVGPIGMYHVGDSLLYFKDVNGYSIIPYPRPFVDYYTTKTMVISTYPGYAFTGKGQRVWNFIEPK